MSNREPTVIHDLEYELTDDTGWMYFVKFKRGKKFVSGDIFNDKVVVFDLQELTEFFSPDEIEENQSE